MPIKEIVINLVAGFLGFLISQSIIYIRKAYSKKVLKWFWNPKSLSKIYLYCGQRNELLRDEGELEPMLNIQDAFSLGELKFFLKSFYPDVFITSDEKEIDWRFPVVSLGGPIPNPLTKRLGETGLLPIWFLDMPYSKESERVLGTRSRGELFKSEFDEHGILTSDVGFVARIKPPENPSNFIYIIASNYGIGSNGIVKFLSLSKKLSQLRSLNNSDKYFQAIIRCHVIDKRISYTELISYRTLF